MFAIQETETKLRDKVDKIYTKPGKGSAASLGYLKVGAVALAMNEAFGPCGWDALLDKIEIVKDAHKINGSGIEDPDKGTYWNAIAYAIVTVKARSLFKADGTYIEVTRQEIGVGSAVGGKQKTQTEAIQNALTSASTNAFKRACRFFSPKTGLTLLFEPGEREGIQRGLDAEDQVQDTTADIEGTPTEDLMTGSDQASEIVTSAQAPAAPAPAAPAAPAPAAPAPAAAAPVSAPVAPASVPTEVLVNLAGSEFVKKIMALDSETPLTLDDLKTFHGSMAAKFGPKAATGLWSTAGVKLGKGAVVRPRDILSVGQVIEEATAGEGGLEAFLAQFNEPAPAPEQRKVEGVKYDSAALAAANAAQPQTHGETAQEMWNESSFGAAERREKFTKIFGTRAPEVIDLLVNTPDDYAVTKENAAKIHGVGLKVIQEMNVPAAEVYTIWKKVGFEFTGQQPRGRHIRAFAENLPK